MTTKTLSRPVAQVKAMSRPEIEKLAARKILMARAAIIQTRRFYGVLIANVEPKPCWAIPTMGTDSKNSLLQSGIHCRVDASRSRRHVRP